MFFYIKSVYNRKKLVRYYFKKEKETAKGIALDAGQRPEYL